MFVVIFVGIGLINGRVRMDIDVRWFVQGTFIYIYIYIYVTGTINMAIVYKGDGFLL